MSQRSRDTFLFHTADPAIPRGFVRLHLPAYFALARLGASLALRGTIPRNVKRRRTQALGLLGRQGQQASRGVCGRCPVGSPETRARGVSIPCFLCTGWLCPSPSSASRAEEHSSCGFDLCIKQRTSAAARHGGNRTLTHHAKKDGKRTRRRPHTKRGGDFEQQVLNHCLCR